MIIRGKWSVTLLVVLIFSVALNLFVAGFAFSKFRQFGMRHGIGVERMLSTFVAGFPREIRHGLHEELNYVQPQFRTAINSLRDARTRMFELMRQDPLDRQALALAMARVRELASVLQKIGHEAVLRAIEDADPEVRARIEPRGPRWWRHRGGD